MTAAPPSTSDTQRRGLVLVATAIVLTGVNLRTAVNSVGPVLQEIEEGLGVSSAAAGVITTLPVLCFAALGFAGPPLAARFRDGHVLAAPAGDGPHQLALLRLAADGTTSEVAAVPVEVSGTQ